MGRRNTPIILSPHSDDGHTHQGFQSWIKSAAKREFARLRWCGSRPKRSMASLIGISDAIEHLGNSAVAIERLGRGRDASLRENSFLFRCTLLVIAFTMHWQFSMVIAAMQTGGVICWCTFGEESPLRLSLRPKPQHCGLVCFLRSTTFCL
jgi:hypothetical protein